MGKDHHPLLGNLEENEGTRAPEVEKPRPSLVGSVWDDENACPVPPEPPPPPVNIADLAEEEDPGIRTLMGDVLKAALRRLARELDR